MLQIAVLRRLVAALALAAGLAGCVAERVKGDSWVRPAISPWGREYTPRRALAADVSGWVVLWCLAGPDLRAADCFPLAEEPKGYGLGEAAVRMGEGISTAHTERGSTRPGDPALVPIFFCRAGRGNCAETLRPALSAFLVEAERISALAESGRCPDAIEAAARTGQPGFEAEIRRTCAARP